MNTVHAAIIFLGLSFFGASSEASITLGRPINLILSVDSLHIGSITIQTKRKHLLGGAFIQGSKTGTIIGSTVTGDTPDSIQLFVAIAGTHKDEAYAAFRIPRSIVSEIRNDSIDRPLFESKTDRINLIGGIFSKGLIIGLAGGVIIWTLLFHLDEVAKAAGYVHI